MKKLMVVAVMGLLVAGCSGIIADARHSALIDATAASAADLNDRVNKPDVCVDLTVTPPATLPPCDCVGEFTKAEIRQIFKNNAALWTYFQQAKSGVQADFPAGLGE